MYRIQTGNRAVNRHAHTDSNTRSSWDVRLIAVHTTSGYLKAQLRIVNRRLSAVEFNPDSIWLVLGYSPQPTEPRIPAEGLTPFTLLPGQAVDVSVFWAYAGERYGVIGVNTEYKYGLLF